MTQKRGLGRGLGALIPGAGSTPAPEQELRTRTRPASESGARSSRPVDMFFSGEQVSTEAERAQQERSAPYDLAAGMARAAAERRGRTAGGGNGRSAAKASSPEKEPTEEEAAAAPAKRTTTKSTTAKRTTSKSTAATGATAKKTTAKRTTAKPASAEPAASKSTGAKSSAAKSSSARSSAAKGASSTSATKKPSAAQATDTDSAPKVQATEISTPEEPKSAAPAETSTESPAAASAPGTSAAAAPAPETPQATDEVGDSTVEDRALEDSAPEDSPVVDVEPVSPTPARSEQAEPDVSAPAVADEAPQALPEPAKAAADLAQSAPLAASDSTDAAEAIDTASRGLVAVPGAEFAEIPIHEVRENPRNPRTMFDDDELDELAYSLREVGVLQPVVVRPIPVTADGESFELVMGERRWRAARRAGLESIPAIIRETSDDDLLRDALLENLHRAQLNPLEEANAYQQLLEDFGCTQDELGERIGRSRPQITNTLRLLRLPALVQRRLASGALSAGHARALLSLDDPALMEELAQRIVTEGLSVRAVERLVARGGQQPATRTVRRSTYDPVVVDLTSRLSNRLEAPVRIDVGKRKGRITLEFTNVEDLERLVENMGLDLPAPRTENDDDA